MDPNGKGVPTYIVSGNLLSYDVQVTSSRPLNCSGCLGVG